MPLIRNWQEGITLERGDVALLENVRFNKGEKKDSEEFQRTKSRDDFFL